MAFGETKKIGRRSPLKARPRYEIKSARIVWTSNGGVIFKPVIYDADSSFQNVSNPLDLRNFQGGTTFLFQSFEIKITGSSSDDIWPFLSIRDPEIKPIDGYLNMNDRIAASEWPGSGQPLKSVASGQINATYVYNQDRNDFWKAEFQNRNGVSGFGIQIKYILNVKYENKLK